MGDQAEGGRPGVGRGRACLACREEGHRETGLIDFAKFGRHSLTLPVVIDFAKFGRHLWTHPGWGPLQDAGWVRGTSLEICFLLFSKRINMLETGGNTLCIRSLGFSRGCFNRLMGHVYMFWNPRFFQVSALFLTRIQPNFHSIFWRQTRIKLYS